MKRQPPALITERLTLRGITREDTPLLVAWRSDPEVYRYFLSPHKLNAEEHLRWYQTRYVLDEARYDFIAEVAPEHIPAGVFGVKRTERSDEAEVSYLLDPKAQKKGYAREAVEALLKWAAAEWSCRWGSAEIHRDNTDSLHFIEGLGFEQSGQNGDFLKYRRKL